MKTKVLGDFWPPTGFYMAAMGKVKKMPDFAGKPAEFQAGWYRAPAIPASFLCVPEGFWPIE